MKTASSLSSNKTITLECPSNNNNNNNNNLKELYGRGIEQGTLLKVYELFTSTTTTTTSLQQSSQSQSQSSSEVVLIHGRQGTGKTALGQSLGSLLESQQCYFASGTFGGGSTSCGLCQAISNVIELMAQQQKQLVGHEIRTIVREAIPDMDDIAMLATRIPTIWALIDNAAAADNKQQRVVSNTTIIPSTRRLMPLLACLLDTLTMAIQRQGYQLVLFLDDLHKATKTTIHFLQSLVLANNDNNNNNNNARILLLLSYCQEQIPWDSFLQTFLSRMKHPDFHYCTTVIETHDLQLNHVDLMVQAMLQQWQSQQQQTMPLSRLVHHKTHGNPHHVVQYMQLLHSRQLLVLSSDKTWNLMRIQAETDVTENVIRNVSFHRLHSLVQDVLKLAACLGKRFSASVLSQIAVTELLEQKVSSSNGNAATTTNDQDDDGSIVLTTPPPQQDDNNATAKIDLVVKIACEEGLLEHAAKGELKFTHERVQQSLLLFIPKDKRPFLHLRIGRHVRAKMEDDQNMDLVFLAVDQFNRAGRILRRREDVIDLCRLNVTAGRIAFTEKASFQEGVDFVEMAIAIVGQWDLWTHDYKLALDIFSTGAQYEAYVGKLDRSHQLISVVLEKATNLSDKMAAYLTKIEILGLEEYAQDAIDLGLDLLEELAERIPRKPNKSDHVKEFLSISLLRRRQEDLLSLGRMTDANKLAAMKILRLLCQFTYVLQDDNLFPFVCLRSMALTLQWGLSPCSASAVASYAVVLGLRQDPRSARFGYSALEIRERHPDKEDEGFLLLLLGRFVSHWRQSTRAQLDMFERAFAVAYDCKQIFLASMAVYCRLEVAFLVGKPLGGLERDYLSLSRSLAAQSNEVVKGTALPLLQLLSCLLHTNGNTKHLAGELLDPHKFSTNCRARGNDVARCKLYYYQIAHAFFFQNWQKVADFFERFQSEDRHLFRTFKTHFLYPALLMHAGVAHYALAKSSFVHTKHAKRLLREVSHFTGGSTDDGKQAMATVCLAVLEAEQALLSHRNSHHHHHHHHHVESHHDEECCYSVLENAMTICRNNQLLQYEAALAARASAVVDDKSKAKDYRARAHLLYRQWGSVVVLLKDQPKGH